MWIRLSQNNEFLILIFKKKKCFSSHGNDNSPKRALQSMVLTENVLRIYNALRHSHFHSMLHNIQRITLSIERPTVGIITVLHVLCYKPDAGFRWSNHGTMCRCLVRCSCEYCLFSNTPVIYHLIENLHFRMAPFWHPLCPYQ